MWHYSSISRAVGKSDLGYSILPFHLKSKLHKNEYIINTKTYVFMASLEWKNKDCF
ncbi:hypothetical protein [Tenacibaculum caenipelagi]|uniref:hypothetical protein n=1 Tax=Tenacibaculum caenipelagi TaxID=1325435 RepID=UPI0014151B03|nr:hypothetical protein [Tenacibaculum caenipelagi]